MPVTRRHAPALAVGAASPALHPNMRCGAVRDFSHVALATGNPSAIVAHPRAGTGPLGELARRHSGSAGLDLVGTSWFGVSGPAGMPQPVVDRLARDIRAILGDEGMLAGFGGTPGAPSPEGFANLVRAEVARWEPVVRESGAQPL